MSRPHTSLTVCRLCVCHGLLDCRAPLRTLFVLVGRVSHTRTKKTSLGNLAGPRLLKVLASHNTSQTYPPTPLGTLWETCPFRLYHSREADCLQHAVLGPERPWHHRLHLGRPVGPDELRRGHLALVPVPLAQRPHVRGCTARPGRVRVRGLPLGQQRHFQRQQFQYGRLAR